MRSAKRALLMRGMNVHERQKISASSYRPFEARQKGRNGRRAKKGNPKTGPTQCGVEQWGWLPLELIASDVWRALSRNARVVVDRVLEEHIAEGGTSNGELSVSYDDFAEAGVTRRRIADAIREAEAAGVIYVRRRGKIAGRNSPNLYRLTWVGGWGKEGQEIYPTNDWKKSAPEDVKRARSKMRERSVEDSPSKAVKMPVKT